MEQGGGLTVCEMWDGPVRLGELLFPFAVLAVLAALAGWLRGPRMWVLRAAGTVLLGLIVLTAISVSWITYRSGIMADATCIATIDDRITGAILMALNAGVILAARRARAGRKPKAGSPKPP